MFNKAATSAELKSAALEAGFRIEESNFFDTFYQRVDQNNMMSELVISRNQNVDSLEIVRKFYTRDDVERNAETIVINSQADVDNARKLITKHN